MFSVIFANGGWILAMIVIASIIAGAVVVERLWRLWPLQRSLGKAWQSYEDLLLAGKIERLTAAVGDGGDCLDRVLRRGLSAQSHGREVVRDVAFEAAQREIPALERGLSVVSTIAHIAPLLGLLGTVAGLIEAFRTASAGADVTAAGLSDGIYLALGTTAAGLTVGIPAWIAYNALVGLVGRLTHQLEVAAGELPILLDTKA